MTIDFEKGEGLIPAIIQHADTLQVLMLGYMNQEALQVTQDSGLVTFYSRSKQRLWKKGEASGNCLHVVRIEKDCDQDAVLISVTPEGPTCHTGQFSCFSTQKSKGFLHQLEQIIDQRLSSNDSNSYTSDLVAKGMHKVAQKVGEEAVETVIAALSETPERIISESADLMYHLLILLRTNHLRLEDIEAHLLERHLSR